MELTTITITCKDSKKIELSLEEAKELYGVLDGLFGGVKEYIPYPTYPTYPSYPNYPLVTWSASNSMEEKI